MAFLDDLANGLKPASGSTSTYNFVRYDLVVGFEGGWLMDHQNVLSLRLEDISGSDGKISNSSGGNTFTMELAPSLLDATLNYRRYFPVDSGTRLFAGLGAGYYLASVNFTTTSTNPTAGLIEGNFSGGAFGGFGEIGEEFSFVKNMTFDLSGGFRWATIDQVTSSNMTTKNLPSLSGTYGMAFGPTQGAVYFFNTAHPLPAGGYRYAVVDYSGISLSTSIRLYF